AGAAAVDAPSGVTVADANGSHGGQQQQQEDGQDEPPVQAGVLEGGEGGDGYRVAGQGDGDERAAPGSRQVFDPAGGGCAHVGTTCIYSYIRCCEPTTRCGVRQASIAGRSPGALARRVPTQPESPGVLACAPVRTPAASAPAHGCPGRCTIRQNGQPGRSRKQRRRTRDCRYHTDLQFYV